MRRRLWAVATVAPSPGDELSRLEGMEIPPRENGLERGQSCRRDSTMVSVLDLIPTNRPPTHPGVTLDLDFREPSGLTREQFAEKLGIDRGRYADLADGRSRMDADAALRIAHVYSMSVDFWLDLQKACDVFEALHAPGAERIKNLPIAPVPLILNEGELPPIA